MQTIIRTKSRSHRRRGVAIVEFAILLPVFLALVLGIVELGGAGQTANTMTSALREGGRLASMDWEDYIPDGMTVNQKVTADIRTFIKASGLPGDEVTISITSAEGGDEGQDFDLADPDNALRLFRISAEIPYSAVSTYPAMFMKDQIVTASLALRAGRAAMGD